MLQRSRCEFLGILGIFLFVNSFIGDSQSTEMGVTVIYTVYIRCFVLRRRVKAGAIDHLGTS